MTLYVYNKTYEASETSEVTIDLVVSIAAVFVSFASLIALIMLYNWIKRKGKIRL